MVVGSQIYACTVQLDGSFAFTQNNVEARLTGGTHHTFVQPAAGPPQWQAADDSAVTGKVVTRNANGAGNIAELDFDATQIGDSSGLLSNAVDSWNYKGSRPSRRLVVGGPEEAAVCDGRGTDGDEGSGSCAGGLDGVHFC